MLYATTESGLKVIVVDSRNLEMLRAGYPLKTFDESVYVAWTPDLQWVTDQVRECSEADRCGPHLGDIIQASLSRPEKRFIPQGIQTYEFLPKDEGQNPPEFGG